MLKKCPLLVLMLVVLQAHSQVFDLVVASDGSGTHTTISKALLSRSSYERIFIKNGVYNEKLRVSKNGVSLIGESAEGVIIQWGDHANDGSHSTATSYTLQIDADDVYLENITVRNTAGNVGQAVAVHTKGDRIAVKNCRFVGFQDTYYVDGGGMVYTTETWVEGATDFVFGDATAVFENCEVNCVKGGQYITAPADPKLITEGADGSIYHGMLFVDCQITAGADVGANSYYLGRPWQPNSSAVYVNCSLGNQIKSSGWSTWSDNNHLSGLYAEYHSMDVDGALIDVTGRVSWSTQLSEDQIKDYYNRDYYLTKPGKTWQPLDITSALSAPQGVGTSFLDLSPEVVGWQQVPGALGYAILRNDSVIGFSETNSFTDESGDISKDRSYSVKTVSLSGALGVASEPVLVLSRSVLGLEPKVWEHIEIRLSNHQVMLNQPSDVRVFTLSGQLVFSKKATKEFLLSRSWKGVYIIKILSKGQPPSTYKLLIDEH